MKAPVRVTFWGVRGSIPTPAGGHLKYGGNTACVEVSCGNGPPLIFDAGTGIRALGLDLPQEPGSATVFLSHFHWDHIQGLPFFSPLYRDQWQVTLCAPVAVETLRQAIVGQMQAPYFPAWRAVRADLRFSEMQAEGFQAEGVLVRAFPVVHPDGAAGYRIEAPHATVVYMTDHEHSDGRSRAALCEHVAGADLLIYDAQFTPAEYDQRKGWGHSTWLEGTRLARDAGVRQLVLFHHDPHHDDGAVAQITDAARREFPHTAAAAEGWSVYL